jgi:hypothetical protein
VRIRQSFFACRVVSGILSVPFLFAAFNYWGHHRWFWPHDKFVMTVAIFAFGLNFVFFAPAIEAWQADEEHQKENQDT